MAYTLTLTNNSVLTVLADGNLDSTHSSLDLVGRNYAGYGQSLNRNFLKLTENFSNSTAPLHPLPGQLWWDSSTLTLKVNAGTAVGDAYATWKVVGGATASATQPTLGVQTGDLWYDSTNQVLKIYTGTGWLQIGPAQSPLTAVTALLPNAVSDGSTLH